MKRSVQFWSNTMDNKTVQPCPLCPLPWKKYNASKLASHTWRLHSGALCCRLCSFRFRSSSLRLHLLSCHVHTKHFECGICGYKAKLLNTFNNHREHYHERVQQCHCSLCSKGFKTKKGLQLHVSGWHLSIRSHVCNECSQSFTQLSGLDYHNKAVHHKGVKNHICDVCGKAYVNETQLVRHRNSVHLKLKRFFCNKCDGAFSRPCILESHIQARHESLKQKCPLCLKQLSCWKGKLRRHFVQVHIFKAARAVWHSIFVLHEMHKHCNLNHNCPFCQKLLKPPAHIVPCQHTLIVLVHQRRSPACDWGSQAFCCEFLLKNHTKAKKRKSRIFLSR